jgi:hypothetical protein
MNMQNIVVLGDRETWSSVQDACVLINAKTWSSEYDHSSGRRVSIQELIDTWKAKQLEAAE